LRPHHRAEALAAAETLAAEGIRARAIDACWVKPMRSTDWRFNGRSRLWARRRSALLSDGVADLHERGVRFSVATAKEEFRETLANSGLADEVDGFYPEVDSGVDAFRQRTNASGAAPGRDR
jgi:hypothetical protein